MKLEELLEKPLKEVLENYVVLYSPECDYIYGITSNEAMDEVCEKYNFDDEQSMDCEPLLPLNVLEEFETEGAEVLTFQRIEDIIENNLDIPLKVKE